MKVRTMKILAFFLCIALSLCFAGCGAAQNESGQVSDDKENGQISSGEEGGQAQEAEENKLYLRVGERVLRATLADNSSVQAFKELLPLTLAMHDYGGVEKVGNLGETLPPNNERISVSAGDLILYQGNQHSIYYSTNTWSLTRIGKIDDITASELKDLLGEGDVTVELFLSE